MENRFDRAKRFVVTHKKEIAVGTGAIVIGSMVGKNLVPKVTYLNINPDQLRAMLDDPTLGMGYNVAKRHVIRLVQVPSK